MTIDPRLIAAQNNVEERRVAFLGSVETAKQRFAPDTLGDIVKAKGKLKAQMLAGDAKREIADKPLVYGGIAAAIGAFFLRKPIGALVSKIGSDDKEADVPAAPAQKPPPRRQRREAPSAAPTIEDFREPTRPVDEKSKKKAPRKPARRSKNETENVK